MGGLSFLSNVVCWRWRIQGWPLPPALSARKQNVGAQSQDRVLIFFKVQLRSLIGPRQAEDCRRPRNLIAGAVGPAEKTIGTVDHVAHPCGSFASPFKPPLLLRERDRGAPVFVFPGRLLLLMWERDQQAWSLCEPVAALFGGVAMV